jgi:hypothetical protein
MVLLDGNLLGESVTSMCGGGDMTLDGVDSVEGEASPIGRRLISPRLQ